jgi:protease I
MSRLILAFVGDIYEDLELWYPKIRLDEAGYVTKLAAETELRTFAGKHGYPAKADLLVADAKSTDYAGLLIPGGFMPDRVRRNPKVQSLVREFLEQGKPVAYICHGGWIPISAKVVKGKRVTGSAGIKDDLENAGGIWVDAPVVIDGNLISSRTPVDLAPFSKALVDALAKKA